MLFANRREAGKLLAKRLSEYSNRSDVVVLAIPRGGVVVAAEVARALHVALDVIVTKKIGAPHQEELAIGAVAEDGEPIFDRALISQLDISDDYLKKAKKRIHKKIADYIKKFRKGDSIALARKVVIVVDDGIATGSTVEAALVWLKEKKPAEIVLAVPTGAGDSVGRLSKLADKTICLDTPSWFSAVGQFYKEFEQVSDEQVGRILSSG